MQDSYVCSFGDPVTIYKYVLLQEVLKAYYIFIKMHCKCWERLGEQTYSSLWDDMSLWV